MYDLGRLGVGGRVHNGHCGWSAGPSSVVFLTVMILKTINSNFTTTAATTAATANWVVFPGTLARRILPFLAEAMAPLRKMQKKKVHNRTKKSPASVDAKTHCWRKLDLLPIDARVVNSCGAPKS